MWRALLEKVRGVYMAPNWGLLCFNHILTNGITMLQLFNELES